MPELIVAPAAPSLTRYAGSHRAMGTVFSIVAYGEDGALCADAGRKAFREIDRLDNMMSHYKADSELSIINRTAGHQTINISAELCWILEQALQYSHDSNGAFDITVGPLMKLWGFFGGPGQVPPAAELAAIRRRIGYRHLILDTRNRTIRFDEPGLELDPGAIGKGYAVDCASRILTAAGITRALLSSGTSSICAVGSPPDREGWSVALSDPLDRRKTARGLQLRDASISVSGIREQFFVENGRIYSHLLDPRTAAPRDSVLMVAVVSSSAMLSDALSTAFFVGGVPWTRSYLQSHSGLTAIFHLPSGPEQFTEIEIKSPTRSSRPPDALRH